MVCLKNKFLCEGLSNADIFQKEYIYPTIETAFYDYERIQIGNLSINNIDKIHFYDEPSAQMDDSAKFLVTDNVDIL